ncbi:hypothetical protein HRS9139_10396 [Pyrenophora teres f. teres]|uniref:Uncharacterized protein n=1 Tax=Pyrenophora teres f. teres TaxID=97479 RepID=A0A6S6WCS6_9PLEO|nr:hypothetical protein HRS9139_10396 [Pyrenophora teres f. teres]KAE8825916.1 hypothetical protein HRS9122_10101 [Pyrenophora teres f. teres]CAE7205208.1 hypothetical protein PTTW11_09261 [Pyrenophora teres f. teres]
MTILSLRLLPLLPASHHLLLSCGSPCKHNCGGKDDDDNDGGGGGDPNDPDEEDDEDDECTTRTVTDCWVSCDAQRTKECTTYSTSLVSECSATGTATTTTGGSCPAQVLCFIPNTLCTAFSPIYRPIYDRELQDVHGEPVAGASLTQGATVFSGTTKTTWGWNRNPMGGTYMPTGNGGNVLRT